MNRLAYGILILSLTLATASGAYAATPPSAVLVKDIYPGTGSSSPYGGVNVNGIFYFAANDGTHGYELWKSDGTTAGTVMVCDIYPGSSGSNPGGLTALGSYVIFTANDGVHGTEVWRSDGTAAGTILLKDIYSGSTSSNPESLCVFQTAGLDGTQAVFFMAEAAPSSYQLWKTDGTVSGTVAVSPTTFSSSNGILASSTNCIFLDTSAGLITSDGVSSTFTTVSTSLDIFGPSSLTFAGLGGPYSGLYMSVSSSQSLGGWEPWYSDGTTAGTEMISDVWPGYNNSEPQNGPFNFICSGNFVYFTQSDGTLGVNLWTVGGATGVTEVMQIVPGPFNTYSYYNLVDNNGELYFVADDSINGYQLWKTNGITTTRITTLSPDLSINTYFQMVAVGGLVYFKRPSDGSLWQSDGTTAGTVQIPLTSGLDFEFMTSSGSRLFFSGTDSTHGTELWTLTYPPPTIATAATATPNPTSGTTTSLSVLGADSLGESTLTYIWSTTGTPPAGVIFAGNGTNDAKNTQVSFAKAGVYTFSCLITDAYNLTVSSSVMVTVSQTLTAIAVSATPTNLFQHQQFTRTGLDQFYQPMTTQPTVTWSVSGGGTGTISSSGYYASNGGIGGPYTVTATSGSIAGTAQVTTTATSLIVVTGNLYAEFNNLPITQTISISGATGGSQTITLTGATFSGGGTSKNQATQTTTQYTILPNSGSTSVSVSEASQPLEPPIAVTTATFSPIVRPGVPASPGVTPSVGKGASNAAMVTVTINPPLPNMVTANIEISANGGQFYGSATVAPFSLSGAGGALTVTGTHQSGLGGTLTIKAYRDDNGALIGQSAPFCVCAHPATITIMPTSYTFIPLTGKNFYGMIVPVLQASDTIPAPPNLLEMTYCDIQEQNQTIVANPAAFNPAGFSEQVGIIKATQPHISDMVSAGRLAVVPGGSGTVVSGQCTIFNCQVCNAQKIAMAKSGFLHYFTTFVESGQQYVTVTDVPSGAPITVNSYTTNPGLSGGTATITTPFP